MYHHIVLLHQAQTNMTIQTTHQITNSYLTLPIIYLNCTIDKKTGKRYTYKNLSTCNIDEQDANMWNNSFSNEIARLVQGIGADIQ